MADTLTVFPNGINAPNSVFSSPILTLASLNFPSENVTAAGTSLATGAAISGTSGYVSNVTAADGTKGVTLPAAVVGDFHVVYNSVATNGLNIYPAGTATAINGGTGGAAIKIEGKTMALLVATSATNWGAIYTVDT